MRFPLITAMEALSHLAVIQCFCCVLLGMSYAFGSCRKICMTCSRKIPSRFTICLIRYSKELDLFLTTAVSFVSYLHQGSYIFTSV